MGKQPVGLLFCQEAFRRIVLSQATFEKVGELYGVTRQAVNTWMVSGRIPPRAISTIATELNLTADEIRRILGPQRKTAAAYARKYRVLKREVERLHKKLQELEL